MILRKATPPAVNNDGHQVGTLFAPHCIDFYKPGHMNQYPTNTEYMYFNFTPRADHYARWLPDFDHKVTFVGLQLALKFLHNLWYDTFFSQPKDYVIAKFKRRMDMSLGPGSIPTDRLEALHDLGYLPIHIKALPEGKRVPIRVPVLTLRNTVKGMAWVGGFIETMFSSELWKKITAASIAYEYRRQFEKYATLTGSPAEFVQWQGHDFSARGMSGVYDSAMTGIGHLSCFTGTDTVSAIDMIEDAYGGPEGCGFVGGSVPATEHSVMCAGGKTDELSTIRRLITEVYPTGVVSVVSDTWDFWQLMTVGIRELKDAILSRQPNALGLCKVVFRPDSGEPELIINGDPKAPPGTPEQKGALRCLQEVFGGNPTSTGHIALDPHVGLIYGDSITIQRQAMILSGMFKNGFASSNIVLGIGSYTYQSVTRDTFGFGYKATYGQFGGGGHDLFKDPITDTGEKRSATGLLRVDVAGGEYVLHDKQTIIEEMQGQLESVYRDGQFERETTWNEVRRNVGFKFY